MQPLELTNFFAATQNLRKVMESDVPLDYFDRLSLENHVALLQITYIEWKQRNREPPAYLSAA